MIKKTTRTLPASGRRTITAGTNITSNVQVRNSRPQTQLSIMASQALASMTPSQRAFTRQLQNTYRRQSVMGATNTSNIAAKPEFIELLPLFVQKLTILDVYGSVAMTSRQQIIPYFKVVAENTKGVTQANTILNSPFVNRQGQDADWTSRVVRDEALATDTTLMYLPILPGSVTVELTDGKYVDDGNGKIVPAFEKTGTPETMTINYVTGKITGVDAGVKVTYQYDNETVGPDVHGEYGASMAKAALVMDEINLRAEAHELACFWSIFSAFAAQQEYGANIGDMAKDAAFSELTAEINAKGFAKLAEAAKYKPQFNWDASPVLSGAVVPHDYLNMFKLKLGQAAASIYQATRLTRPNKLVVGSTAAEYIGMIDGFQAENISDSVGPYKFGKLDQFDVYVDPNYNPNKWVMCCKSNDIRRNSALFGEYMPLMNTDAIGLANASVQQGYATMYAMEVVNPDTVVSGNILGTF